MAGAKLRTRAIGANTYLAIRICTISRHIKTDDFSEYYAALPPLRYGRKFCSEHKFVFIVIVKLCNTLV